MIHCRCPMMTSAKALPYVRLAILVAALGLIGCASPPPAPEWQGNAFAALNSYSSAYLSGNSRVADDEFSRAQSEIASTGRADLMARAELLRCATRLASLELQPCAGYQSLSGDAKPQEHAYAAFMNGQWSGLDPAQLPAHYRVLVTQTTPTLDHLSQIADPLARLIAAGVLLKREQLTPAAIAMAVETASSQGWRRPLLAWLGLQLQQAQQNPPVSAHIQRQINLVFQASSKPNE